MANDLIFSGSRNRVAFPKARVFIYGQEVSSDVVSIRINQSSGSLERTPGTCSISLVNPNEKYILSNKDMRKIGELKHKINGTWSSALKAQYDSSSFDHVSINAVLNDLYLDPYETENGRVTVSSNEGKWDVDVAVKGDDAIYPLGGKSLDKSVLQQLASQFAYSSSQEIYQTLAGMTDDSGNPLVLNESDAYTLSKLIQEAVVFSNPSYNANDVFNVVVSELDVPYGVKQDVVSKKMQSSLHIIPDERNYEALNYEDRLIYEYPMSEGDCIFHANDPVRVALRDPFNPLIWYWSFTGFVDTSTEESGVNKDSLVTLSCTDVTKMARYATVGINTGITEASEAPVGTIEGAQNATNLGVILDQELFSNLPIYSIIETLFFGSQSASKISDAATAVLVRLLSESTKEEIDQYLRISDNKSLEEWYRSISKSSTSSAINSNLKLVEGSNDYDVAKNKVLDDLKVKRRGKLNSLDYPGISSPRHVNFKRKSIDAGLYFYVYGDPDEADNAVGAVAVKDLKEWNDVIHHRIRTSDVKTMHINPESQVEAMDNLSIDQVMWRVGTDIDNYPVGGGRVFYMAPAGLTSVIGLNALDRVFGGTGSVHSTFKDRLSYLYDLADAIDWRFYATPKGDLVFEMPFYDYDPGDFWGSKEVTSEMASANRQKLAEVTNNAFLGKVNVTEANFTPDDWDLLYDEVSLYSGAFNLSGENQVDLPYNYSSCFSINEHEQSGYSNTNTDNGVITSYRTSVNWVEGNSAVNSTAPKKIVVYDPTLFPTLGFRQSEGEELWHFIDSNEEAAVFAALQLNKTNSNARNLSIDTVPKFGLMVNRPVHWRFRNYYCTTVSMAHSLVWNSDVSSSVNLHNVRTWSGELENETGKMVFRHFGDSNRPFNIAVLFKELNEQRKGSVSDGSKYRKNFKFYFY